MTAAATDLKSHGVPLPVIVESLYADEATALDLTRLVMALDHVVVARPTDSLGEATLRAAAAYKLTIDAEL